MTEEPTILVLDDDRATLELIRNYLKGSYNFVGTTRFEQMKTLIQEKSFDVLITDLKMPDVTAIDVIRYVRSQKEFRWMPIVLITGYEQSEEVFDCIREGADAKFAKPLDFKLFRVTLESLVKRKRQQENLIDRNEALKNLYLSREEFMTRVSHEFKTPIHAIMGYISLLTEKSVESLTQKQAEYLKRIGANASTLLELIDQTLDYKKHEQRQTNLNLELVNVEKVVTEVLQNYESLTIENGIQVQTKFNLPKTPLLLDKEKFALVFSNLISNSIKATNAGAIQVNLRAQKSEGKQFLIMEIVDSGHGMSESEKDRIYQLFYGHKDYEVPGGSIGLSNVRKALDLLSGSLYFESNEESGTRFFVGLPLE